MKQKRRLGIEDVDPLSQDIGRLSSPLTLQAMKELGLELADLIYIPKAEFHRMLLHKETLDQRYLHHEDKRMEYINSIKKERSKLLERKSQSPISRPSDSSLRSNPISPLRDMEIRERNRLLKLQIHKDRTLEQILASDLRHQQLLQELEEAKQRELQKEKQRLEELHNKQKTFAQQKLAFEAKVWAKQKQEAEFQFLETKQRLLTENVLSSPISCPERKSVQFETKLSKIHETLQKRAQARRQATNAIATDLNQSEIMDKSLAKKVKLLETEDSVKQLQSEHSFELEEKFKRHEEKTREMRRKQMILIEEKRAKAELKAEHIQALEKEREQHAEEKRKQLKMMEKHAEIRLLESLKTKEDHLLEFAQKEAIKRQQSDLRRRQIHEQEAKKAEIVLSELQESDRKIEELRSEKAKEWAMRKETLSERRTDRYHQARRLRKIEEYNRMKTLEQIQEENEAIFRLKSTKERELVLKQRLRKELESEKKSISDRFEKLVLARTSKLQRSLETGRPISLTPIRSRILAGTPIAAAPEPQSLKHSASNEGLALKEGKLGPSNPAQISSLQETKDEQETQETSQHIIEEPEEASCESQGGDEQARKQGIFPLI